jgi:hypothetical protein
VIVSGGLVPGCELFLAHGGVHLCLQFCVLRFLPLDGLQHGAFCLGNHDMSIYRLRLPESPAAPDSLEQKLK